VLGRAQSPSKPNKRAEWREPRATWR
jgi:hypothetical protein